MAAALKRWDAFFSPVVSGMRALTPSSQSPSIPLGIQFLVLPATQHFPMIETTIHRYSTFRACCKFAAVFMVVGILLAGALGRLELVNLLWAAAPLAGLWLMDVGYAAQEERWTEIYRLQKPGELPVVGKEDAVTSAIRTLRTMGGLSVWPIYLGLACIVFAGGRVLPKPLPPVVANASGYNRQGPGGAMTQSARPLQVQGLPQKNLRPTAPPPANGGVRPPSPTVPRPPNVGNPSVAPPVAPASPGSGQN